MKWLLIFAAVIVAVFIGFFVWYLLSAPEVVENDCAPAESAAALGRGVPNVIIISIDTLRADYVGAYGSDRVRTPHIDALAEEGVLFSQATTPFPRTTPALASLLTGLRPISHGSREVGDDLKQGRTLAEELCEHGFATAAVSANGTASHRQSLDRGFAKFVLDRGQQASDVTDLALELAAEARDERPLFLWVHYMDPHFIYKPPSDWRPDDGDDSCLDLMWSVTLGLVERAEVYDNRDDSARAALASCEKYYAAEVDYTDHHVGRLLDGLQRLGRLEGAVTILTSDHGENLGEHDLYYEHGPSPHDASARVPLIIGGSGIAAGSDDGIASLEDVMPTILDLLGVPEEEWPEMDGRSLASRLEAGADGAASDQRRVAYIHGGRALSAALSNYPLSGRKEAVQCVNGPRYSACWEPDEPVELYDRRNDPEREEDLAEEAPGVVERLAEAKQHLSWDTAYPIAVRTPRFKLVAFPELTGERRYELFDLQADPDETDDVLAEHPEVAGFLRAKLDGWFENAAETQSQELSDEMAGQLRALGYID